MVVNASMAFTVDTFIGVDDLLCQKIIWYVTPSHTKLYSINPIPFKAQLWGKPFLTLAVVLPSQCKSSMLIFALG